MTEDDAKVLPCPFCGRETRLSTQYIFKGTTGERTTPGLYTIACDPCGILMYDTDKDKLLERWNRRTIS